MWRKGSNGVCFAVVMFFAWLQPITVRAEYLVQPAGYHQPISIRNDLGGSVVRYAQTVNRIRKQGRLVEISGRCDSACTLLLALPLQQVCIHQGASFGFHRAFGSNPTMNEWGTKYLIKSYPAWVKRWINDSGGLSHSIKRLTFQKAAHHIRKCDTQLLAQR
mgnify:FL=1